MVHPGRFDWIWCRWLSMEGYRLRSLAIHHSKHVVLNIHKERHATVGVLCLLKAIPHIFHTFLPKHLQISKFFIIFACRIGIMCCEIRSNNTYPTDPIYAELLSRERVRGWRSATERTPSEAPEESPTPRIKREQRTGGHIEKAFIDALLLANRNLATFTIEAATKVAIDAYGYDIYTRLVFL